MTTDMLNEDVEELIGYCRWLPLGSAERKLLEAAAIELVRRLAEAEQKIAERDAMLAHTGVRLHNILHGLPCEVPAEVELESLIADIYKSATAKANAEILKAAYWTHAAHNRFSGLDAYEVCTCDLCRAVRAAKEIKTGSSPPAKA